MNMSSEFQNILLDGWVAPSLENSSDLDSLRMFSFPCVWTVGKAFLNYGIGRSVAVAGNKEASDVARSEEKLKDHFEGAVLWEMGWHQVLAAGCTVFALAMLVLVVTSHQWISVESTRQVYYSGIWKICTKMVCTSIHASKAYFEFIRFLHVLAFFSGFFCSSYMLFTYRYLPTFHLARFLFAAIGCFITGFLMLISTTIYTVFIVIRGIYSTATVTYQPTFYLAWCLGPIFAITGFLCLMAHYFMPIHRISLTDQDSLNRCSTSDMRILSSDSYRNPMGLGSMAAL